MLGSPKGTCEFARNAVTLVALALLFSSPALAQPDWVQFTNETGTRLVAGASVGTSDTAEKDYAWGDVDQDGDIDMVIARKLAFTSGGSGAFRTNVLLLNHNGVLTDETANFAATSDVAGDNGFLTPTNDRDIILADVTGDGWLDIITATTLSDGFPKHISHPRVYRNLGMVAGSWGGFIHEDARIPALAANTGAGVPHAPRFCSVREGDIDEDGDNDLYFGDYDSGGGQTLDFNDRLLLNDGTGHFTDATATQFSSTIIVGGQSFPFQQSAFGMAVAIEDMNGDGHLDIVKDTALNPPQYVGIAYSNPANPGAYTAHKETFPNMAPYHIAVGDLNNDNLLDLVVTDDAADSYLLNQGNDAQGLATFSRFTYNFVAGGDDGFGGNSVIAGLDNDGFNDVIITDIDVDIGPCSNRRMHIYHNLGNLPNVTLRQEADGAESTFRPNNVHDAAVFDVDGDGYLDMVLGTCTTTQVWINEPPIGVDIAFPNGLPTIVGCTGTTTAQVQLIGSGFGIPAAGGLQFFASFDGSAFMPQPTTDLGSDLYEVTIDGNLATESISYYFSATEVGGSIDTSPATAPADSYSVIVADNLISDLQNFEGAVTGWTVSNGGTLTAGGWELVDPVGTGAAPENDAGAGSDVKAWVTGNGVIGGTTGASDIDGGPTVLISPVIDLSAGDAQISFDLWYVNQETQPTQFDTFTVQVTNNGTGWITALSVMGGVDLQQWVNHSFNVADFVVPSATVQVRFIATDSPNNSVTEAGIDNFAVSTFSCGSGATTFRRGDINGDSSTDISDAIGLLQGLFDPAFPLGCTDSADANDDGLNNIADAIRVLDMLFAGGVPLPDPIGNCGVDPTDTDALDCVDNGSCP